VFFRNQDLTTPQQEQFFQHYGILDTHPAQADRKTVDIKGSTRDWREDLVHTPWPVAALHADTSFEINPPSYAMLRMEEHPPVGGDTLWVSQYGTYDALSKTMKTFADSQKVIHTSWLQYQTIISLWGAKPRRAPIDTEHPLVRTHPVTGLKALNINPGFSTRIVGLKKAESDKLFEFFVSHLADAADHQVRWKWEVGSVAMWDNRVTAHRVIPGKYKEPRRGVRTTVFGERPYFDQASEGREEREERIAAARGETARGNHGRKFLSTETNGTKVATPS
jgi:alpha-ketoglutarate-dependent taurine dioxygenase